MVTVHSCWALPRAPRATPLHRNDHGYCSVWPSPVISTAQLLALSLLCLRLRQGSDLPKAAQHLSSHPAPRALAPTGRAVLRAPLLVCAASSASPREPEPHSTAPHKASPTKTTLTHTELAGRSRGKYLGRTPASPSLVRPCSPSATFTHVHPTGETVLGQRMWGPQSLGLAWWW